MRYDADDPWVGENVRALTPEGEMIPLVKWADTETGELGVFPADPDHPGFILGDGDVQPEAVKRPFRLMRIDTGETLAECP